MRAVPFEFDECLGFYTTYARASTARHRAIKKYTDENLNIGQSTLEVERLISK